jgi:two-component system sensor histidine kinase KdpD
MVAHSTTLSRRELHDRLRDRLLATAAHQLRGPLSVITGMASVLRATEDGRMREGLDTIALETARLARMLENLFAVTRFSPDKPVRRDWIPVEDVVGTALGRLEDELAGREIGLALEPPVLAHADPVLLELLLVNLIDNAVRHTPAGTPFEISARRDNVVVVIELSDRGPGIPAGVFDRPIGTSRGLGFDVCRGIADAHGGAVVAWAREGGGSVVLVTLPDAAPLPKMEIER